MDYHIWFYHFNSMFGSKISGFQYIYRVKTKKPTFIIGLSYLILYNVGCSEHKYIQTNKYRHKYSRRVKTERTFFLLFNYHIWFYHFNSMFGSKIIGFQQIKNWGNLFFFYWIIIFDFIIWSKINGKAPYYQP